MKLILKYSLGHPYRMQPASLKPPSHGFSVYSLAILSCTPEELPTTKCAIKTDMNWLIYAVRKMLSVNPNAHPHPEPNQSGKPLPQT